MYTLSETSPPRPDAGFQAPDPPGRRECPLCGSNFRPRRSDQKFCRAECRAGARRLEAQRRRQRPRSRRYCAWCGLPFEALSNQEYCGAKCRHDFNNWAKGWGSRLIGVLFAWRYRGRRVCLSEVCQTVAAAWDDLRARRAAAASERNSGTECPPASTQSPPGTRPLPQPGSPRPPLAQGASCAFSSQVLRAGADGDSESGGQV